MEKIEMEQLNFQEMTLLTEDPSYESFVFLHHHIIYKIFKSEHIKDLKNKEKKVALLSQMSKIPEMCLPQKGIYHQDQFIGYTMSYFSGKSLSFYTFASNKKKMYLLQEAKQILEQIHQYQILLGDINEHNILVNDKGKIAFCDLDNCSIQGYPQDNFRDFQQEYLKNHDIDLQFDYYNFNITCLSLLTKIVDSRVLYEIQNHPYRKKIEKQAFEEFLMQKPLSGSPYLLDHVQKRKRFF